MIGDDDVLAMIIAAEGQTYTNDPLDAGGPTKCGITQRVLAEWRGHPVTPADVAALQQPEAEAIYRARYLAPFGLLPDGLRQNVVDMGVNAGQSRAAKLVQQMIGADADGVIGLQTLRLLAGRDWTEFYSIMRLAFYAALIERTPSQIKWRNGWRHRALRFVAPPAGVGLGLVAAGGWPVRVGKAYEVAA